MTERYLNVRPALMVVLLCGLVLSAAAQANVRLDNTIKKVEISVNGQGEAQRKLVAAASVVPGDELQYTVAFTNEGEQAVDAGTIVITDAIPPHTFYVDGTAYGAGTEVEFSVDGNTFAAAEDLTVNKDGTRVPASAKDYTAIRWIFAPELKPGATGRVSFNVRLK